MYTHTLSLSYQNGHTQKNRKSEQSYNCWRKWDLKFWNLPQRNLSSDSFISYYNIHLRIKPVLHKLFQRMEIEGIFPRLF